MLRRQNAGVFSVKRVSSHSRSVGTDCARMVIVMQQPIRSLLGRTDLINSRYLNLIPCTMGRPGQKPLHVEILGVL
jgi:hypothetical protein